MRNAALALICAGLLAACGADGAPTAPPPKDTAKSGLSVSGQARVGVSVSRGAGAPWAAGG